MNSLESEVERLQRERDELFDELDHLEEEMRNIETYEEDHHELGEIKTLIRQLQNANDRKNLGISHASEEFDRALEQILEYKL